ncbi:hypothetical protein CVIRNUC_006912 [Coccomyxa viridis]|uniref:Alanine racemase C-terminal domain-containing protein n=1 Tax=Coccomyxa viridis TaxID=1274662 RepID=A0AAV1I923_9CHLO|nr:hypothetical protein CVIRNUC_006912 [Coccomyxa viridis]
MIGPLGTRLSATACLAVLIATAAGPSVLGRQAGPMQSEAASSGNGQSHEFGYAAPIAAVLQASIAPAPATAVTAAAPAPALSAAMAVSDEDLFSPGLSGAERRRFTVEDDSTGPPVLDLATTDSNTWLEVNYTQLVATGRRLLPRVKPGTIAMAMVKGGGYGHGVVTAAKAFLESGYAEIGTGTLNEALALRRSGVTAPVHLCYQPDIQSARAVAHAHDVQVYVEDKDFLSALCRAATAENKTTPVLVHITVSTGAVREGVRTEAEALALGHQVAACPGLHLRGVMTHHGRLDVFQPIVKAFKDTFGQDIIAHMATSTSGFFQGQEYHLDLVRLGTVNYLFGNQSSSSAARWLTRITGIKQVHPGDMLGYDETSVTRNMTIAVTNAGTVDGADTVTEVVIRGKVCRVVGHGGMNMHMIDITDVPDAKVGDLVMMHGCCADDGRFLNVWVPSIWPNVERIEIRGSEGAYHQEQQMRLNNATSSGSYALAQELQD